jgi:hypothetical protein
MWIQGFRVPARPGAFTGRGNAPDGPVRY